METLILARVVRYLIRGRIFKPTQADEEACMEDFLAGMLFIAVVFGLLFALLNSLIGR